MSDLIERLRQVWSNDNCTHEAADEIERLTTEVSELKGTISILTQLNEQKTDDRYDDWAFSEDGYMRRGKALRVENERLTTENQRINDFRNRNELLANDRLGEIRLLTAENERLTALLRVAACPNRQCTDGAIPHGPDPDGGWEVEQCQWCCERDEALAAVEVDDD